MRITTYILMGILLVLFLPACSYDVVAPKLSHTLSVTDIDGNNYKVVKIGDQLWMAENLKVTRYRNGEEIPLIIGEQEWKRAKYGAAAVYPHGMLEGLDSGDEVANVYGLLYNWYAINRICPEGWHIPSDDDWKTLEMHLGISREHADRVGRRGFDQGGQIKSQRTEPDPLPSWKSPNNGATDEFGFSALPSGFRYYDGSFGDIGLRGGWWSSSVYGNSSKVWTRILSFQFGGVYREFGYMQDARSVRCISY
jgi:uncharacterized protein (TIGR02145 family)